MQFMIYHIYSVQKQHNGKEAFSRGLTTVWINYYAFPALGANCSLLKAQEEDQDNDGEEGQTVLSNWSNIVNFSVSTKLYSILRLHSGCFVQLHFCLISTQILHQESFIRLYLLNRCWVTDTVLDPDIIFGHFYGLSSPKVIKTLRINLTVIWGLLTGYLSSLYNTRY